MSHPSFAVSRFENRNGVFSYRVQGLLNGVRIRRNFKTQEEAAAEKAVLEIKALQLASNLRSVPTHLTEEQVREAEAVFRRLSGKPQSLSFYLDYALANYREPQHQKLLTEAVTAYEAVKMHQHAQKLISASMLTTIKRQMKAFKKAFPGAAGAVANLTVDGLTAYFARGKIGLKTYNNRRGIAAGYEEWSERERFQR